MDCCLLAEEAVRFLRIAVALLDIGRAPKSAAHSHVLCPVEAERAKTAGHDANGAGKGHLRIVGAARGLHFQRRCMAEAGWFAVQLGYVRCRYCRARGRMAGASLQSASRPALEFGDAV